MSFFGSAPNARMRSVFFRSLGTMFASGVPLVSALEMLSDQQEHPALAEAARGMARKLQEGHYLSKAMQSYPQIFQSFHQKMIMSGERSGRLNAVLTRVADREERHNDLQQKVRASLTMPLLVSAFCISLTLVAPPLLFRGLFEMLKDLGGQLPWTTRLLLGFSGLLSNPFFWLLAGGGLWGLRWWTRRLREEAEWQRKIMSLPLFGPSLRLIYTTSFVQNLSIMLEVGMPMLHALELSAQSTDLLLMEELIARVATRVKEGEELSEALAAQEFFPSTLIQGVRASEEAGGMPKMLRNLESIFRLELDQRLEVLTKALEPLVLSLIGVLVGFTLIATLQPLLSVMDSL